ncbi:dolichyl-diphosphooligosaccharide-protein glycotransferase [Mycena vulgaris]|nr:dolichyl-diphosphooligosaccharide-protein glycotransferase [Mycena vulgaris]
MLLLTTLALFSFPLTSAATSDVTHRKLVSLAASGRGLIKLDSASYDLLTAPHRDWSASIEFTALDAQHGCARCTEFHASWSAVAKAWWSKAPWAHRDSHFFATLDFDDDPTVIQTLGIESGPVFYNYPPMEGPRATGESAPLKYGTPRHINPLVHPGVGAEALARHISTHTPIPIPYSAPRDWRPYTTTAAGLLVSGLALRFALPILQSRWTWALASILPSIVLTAGYMFTRIRDAPFVGADGAWIARGPRDQFGQEVVVVTVFYATLGLAFIMLIMVVPYQSSARRQRLQIYLWSALIMLVYSVLVVFFKSKNRGAFFRSYVARELDSHLPGYPFRLFL